MARICGQGRIVVTGGTGFLGRNLIDRLLRRGERVLVVAHQERKLLNGVDFIACDLRSLEQTVSVFSGAKAVFHLAAHGLSFEYNRLNPALVMHDNLLMNTNVVEASRLAGNLPTVLVSSSSVYDWGTSLPDDTQEWSGLPHDGERFFAWSKRMLELLAQSYIEQWKSPLYIVRPTNPFGLYDSTDPESAHVIPALIIKALSKESEVVVRGTGHPKRNFVFATDVANMMITVLERGAPGLPYNLATSVQCSIAQVATMICRLCGRTEQELRFDLSFSDGHPGRMPTCRRIEDLAWGAVTPLEAALECTVDWYQSVLGRGAN